VLEDAGIKLATVATDILGGSSPGPASPCGADTRNAMKAFRASTPSIHTL
jgi:hypothetical protein